MRTHATWVGRASLLLLGAAASALASGPRSFPTPEAAVDALAAAARTGDAKKILDVLGSDAKSLISSGDTVADHSAGERFLEQYDQAHALMPAADGVRTLAIGTDQWPFPIPLAQGKAGWTFDVKAGKEEVLARRVGRNELDAIQVCLAYVDAQREYRERNPQGSVPAAYAKLLVSNKGKRDGLYWPAEPGAEESPLGPRVGGGKDEGYHPEAGKAAPYHGYFYRILTAQGPHADGGAVNYLVKGQLYGGFALVAWPATYGNSGITTFVVNHAGVVFQKDLGPDTASKVKAMKTFDPDSSWTRVQH
ncbi:MAG TPA: DUF2950 domain-containing protein [Myxococcaceae bacterium]|jgi:hypothetical protein